MKVRILQHLCPMRHCIAALPYEAADGQEIPAHVERLQSLETMLRIDPWCGICGSRQLFFEDRATVFNSMDEARGPLREMEEAQAATRAFLKASKG
jgi:hypothetical protein